MLTRDVVGLARFYRTLFGLEPGPGAEDPVHQFILSQETALTIYDDGVDRKENQRHICIAFTVEDVDKEYGRLQALGVEILAPPALRPWGAKNMMFADPQGNQIVFRSFPKASAAKSKEEG